jgi:superfamily II DNA or RNA helicase
VIATSDTEAARAILLSHPLGVRGWPEGLSFGPNKFFARRDILGGPMASPAKPAPACDPADLPDREKLLFHFLREAPRLVGAGLLGVASAPVAPWPHQREVVRRAVEAYPRGFLFCDEVGLGKTIEAALALRQLLLSGRVARALILVPKALLRQWQEELHEKAALEVPIYDGRRCFALDGGELRPLGGRTPWEAFPLLLASSQLFRRRKRQEELLRAPSWDLVIVDEAHHARRSRGGRANRLLELLAGHGGGGRAERGGLKQRTRCLYLLTATPMQVDPVELWDLLRLVGLGGAWGASEENFLRYFAELRRPAAERDAFFIASLLRDALEMASSSGEAAGEAAAELEKQLAEAPAYVAAVVSAARRGDALAPLLEKAEQEILDGWLRALTPVRFLIWRSTRKVLRAYQAAGRLDALLPQRHPQNLWIALRPAELALYRRIDDYLARHYQRFEARRKGLGFVMTLYRRRLTSSFHAVQQSLERRRAFLLGEAAGETLFGDLEDEDAELEAAEIEPEAEAALFAIEEGDEKAELEGLLAELARLAGKQRDTKLDQLRRDLAELVGSGKSFDRAIVFTQYLDTLDFLRRAFAAERSVATYSGRGGEIFRAGAWLPYGKEDLKEAFARGEIELLICTDAASEGLNLQSCGLLINYDMPWNPMRVEQRIGRIDRLGQVHPEIVVRNYFYRDTVEAEIYRRLADRIGFFQEIVGPLQPILHRLGEKVRKLAMVPEAERQKPLEEDLRELERSFEEIGPDPLDVGRVLLSAKADEPPPAASAAEVEALFLGSRAFGHLFAPDPEQPGAYQLAWRGERRRVTFRPELFARFPYRLRLLTWGQPLFSELLAAVPPPAAGEEPGGLGFYTCRHPFAVGLFLTPAGPVERLAELEAIRESVGRGWSARQESEAATLFSRARRRVLQGLAGAEAGRRKNEKQSLVGGARQLLVEAALVELARARYPGIFEAPPAYGFGEEAVAAQAARGETFALLALIAAEGGLPAARAEDPFFLRLAGLKPGTLEKRRSKIEAAAEDLAGRWKNLEKAEEEAKAWSRDPSEGMLERAYFLAPPKEERSPVSFLEPAKAFEGAVPFYQDLAEAGRQFLEAIAEGADPQADEKANPQHHQWLALEGRHKAASGLFAADLPAGGRGLFKLGSRPPRGGMLLLVHSPETGFLLGTLQQEKKGRPPILQSAEDPAVQWPVGEESELVILAFLLERLA